MQGGETPAALRGRHRAALKLADRYQGRLVRLVQAVGEALVANESGGRTPSTFPAAYGLLASKCISHAESIRALTGIGRYGDAHVILRGLMSDAFMCRFLWEYQEKIPAWFNYAQQRDTFTKQERLKVERTFGDAAVRRGLEGRGVNMKGIADLYGVYSEASHGSSWGARFFARRDSKSQHMLLLTGHVDKLTANTLSLQTIFFIDRILLNAVFVWLDRERSNQPWARRLVRRYERFFAELDAFYAAYADYAGAAFARMPE